MVLTTLCLMFLLLPVLDATERNFTTLNAHAPITRPRSSPERQPTKRLKTNQGWIPRHGRQEREMSPAPHSLTRPRFFHRSPRNHLQQRILQWPRSFLCGKSAVAAFSESKYPAGQPRISERNRFRRRLVAHSHSLTRPCAGKKHCRAS